MTPRIAVIGIGLMRRALGSEVSTGRVEPHPATIIDFYNELAGLETR